MEPSSTLRILMKNTFWVYVGKILSQLISVISIVLVIRKLPVSMYGTYNLLLAAAILISPLTTAPILSVFRRYIPELSHNGEIKKLKTFAFIGLGLSLLVVSLFIVTAFFFQTWLGRVLKIDHFSLYFPFLSLYIIVFILRGLIKSILTSLLLHKYSSILKILYSLCRASLLILLLNKLTINLILLIESLSIMIIVLPGFIIFLIHIAKQRDSELIQQMTPVSRNRIIKYGAFSVANEFGASIIGKTSDFFIISIMSSQVYVGLYAFAIKIFDIIYRILPYEEFISVLQPLYIKRYVNSDNTEMIKVYNMIVKVMLPLYTLPFLYFIVFGEKVILHIFDPKYLDSYLITIIVLATNISIAFFYPLALTIQLKERMDIALYSKIVVVFSVSIGIISMKYLGILGVAITSFLGDLFKNLFMLNRIKKEVAIKYHIKKLIPLGIVYLLISALFLLSTPLITNIYVLILISGLYGAAALVSIILFQPFDEFELNVLQKIAESSKPIGMLQQVILRIHSISTRYRMKKNSIQ